MTRMNLSRFITFKVLINKLSSLNKKALNVNKQSICIEIKAQINRIYTKQGGGYWQVTEGDKVFISYMTQLMDIINTPKITQLKNLLSQAEEQSEKKIRVVFFAQEASVWPSLKSVYEACCTDERFSALLVHIPFSHANTDSSIDQIKPYVEMGLPIIPHEQYNLSEDSPDVAFFLKPYDGIPMQFYISAIDKVVRRCVYIPYAFFDIPTAASIRYGYQLPLHYKAWKIIAYSQHHLDYIKEFGFRNGENAVIIGHPKFDCSSGMNGYPENETTVAYRRKINGRKTLLWNTHFGINNTPESVGAFLQYKEFIFSYFKNHQSVVLLWRPHPFFFGALRTEKIMTDIEIDEFKEQLYNEENIIIDDSKDYLNSFILSDGMLSDGGSSMAFEYTATGKPVYYTVKQNGYVMPKDSIAECWYWINNKDELVKFLDMFSNSEDPMKEERMEKSKKHIGPVDGHCGERIINYIERELVKEEEGRAKFD